MALRQLTPELIEANYASGAWQRRALYEVIDEHAKHRPDVLATADQHERLSYADLVGRSHSLAAWLLDQGLRPGSSVALQSPNRAAIALTHLACNRADLTFVPLSNAWRHTEIAHLLKVSRAEILIVPQAYKNFDYLQMINELRPDLPNLRLVGMLDGDGGDFNFAEVSNGDPRQVNQPRDPNVGRYVMVTSGTTDLPHMSLWTDNNLWFLMQHFIEAVEMREDDVAVGLAPANTGATGYIFPVLGPLLRGASSVLLEEWDPSNALQLLESEHVSLATAIPTQVVKLLQDETLGGRDLSTLRVFTNAGAAMPPHAAKEMEDSFGCIGHVIYGATDGGVPAMTRVSDPPDKRHSTVGKPDLGEVRLVDPAGHDVAEGEPGEILWRTPTKTFGYLNDPDRTASAFIDDGWYKSGDLGCLDEEGYLTIVGREKDLIIRGGQNISPQELETIISRHPAVAEVSVIGLPDPVYGERTCACVVTRKGQALTLAGLVEFLDEANVAKFKFPERLELFPELPKSAGGKITKVVLRSKVASRTDM